MADEIKKVISVDLGNTATSLRDYKKHIDDLKGSLLQLDETSEEYEKISKEITNEQNKLNEVMKVGKTTTDAAEGSYNHLAQTMAELKKQWKATTDEVERNELGAKILDINNQLKELDASTGNYQRNVGDYSNAFEQAFDKCLDGIQTLDGPLAQLGGTVKNMIPIIKSINSTALSGLSGIKKGIASTGIGILVVALGTIISHWEDIAEATDKAIRKAIDYKEVVNNIKELTKQLKESTEQIKLWSSAFDQAHKLRVAQGMDENESLQILYDETEKLIKQKEEELRLNKDNSDAIEREVKFIKRRISDNQVLIDQGGIDLKTRKKLKEEIKDLNKQLEEYNDSTSDVSKANEELNNEIKEQRDLLKSIDSQMQINSATAKKSAEDKAKEELKAEKEKNQKIAKERAEAAKKAKEELEKESKSILDTLHKNTTDELTLLRERYEKELEILNKTGKDTVSYTEWYENEVRRIRQESNDLYIENLKNQKFTEEELKSEQLLFENEMSEKIVDNKLFELDEKERLAQRDYEISQNLLQYKIDFISSELEEYQGSIEVKIELEQELDSYRQEFANNERKRAKETAEYKINKEKEASEITKQSWKSASSSISSILGSLSDLMEEGSEEQKNLQIAETTINTLSGAIAAYQSMAGIPYVGPALGAAAAAAVTIAGIANINKIKSTNMNGNNSGASVSPPQISTPTMTTVNPLLDEQQDLNRMEMSGLQGDSSKTQQNLRVYVVDQDIRDANYKASVVESNATY